MTLTHTVASCQRSRQPLPDACICKACGVMQVPGRQVLKPTLRNTSTLCLMPVTQPLSSRTEPLDGEMNVLARKTEPALGTPQGCSAHTLSWVGEQGQMKPKSASAVIQRDYQPCAVATTSSAGSTVIVAPYSASSTNTSTLLQTDQSSCMYQLEESEDAHDAERSAVQHCQPRCSHSKAFHLAQTEQIIRRNDDNQSGGYNPCLCGDIEQSSTQMLAPGLCEKPHQREVTRDDEMVGTAVAATRMVGLHADSTGQEEAVMHLQKQLDLFDEDSMFLGRFAMLGRHHRRTGGTLTHCAAMHAGNCCEHASSVLIACCTVSTPRKDNAHCWCMSARCCASVNRAASRSRISRVRIQTENTCYLLKTVSALTLRGPPIWTRPPRLDGSWPCELRTVA